MVTRRSYTNDPVMNLHQTEQDFSIFGKREEIYKLYPKEKPEHIDTALQEFLTVGQDDEDDFAVVISFKLFFCGHLIECEFTEFRGVRICYNSFMEQHL